MRILLLLMTSLNAVKVTSYAQMKQLIAWEGTFIRDAKFSIDKERVLRTSLGSKRSLSEQFYC